MSQIENSIWYQANQLLVAKRLQESKVKFQELVDINGAFVARGYFGLGLVERESNNIEEAIKAFEQAQKEDPMMEGPPRLLAQLAPRGVYGAYEFLRQHPLPQAQDALVLMNELRIINKKRPSLTAYLLQFMPFLCALLILLISFIILMVLFMHLDRVSRLMVRLSILSGDLSTVAVVLRVVGFVFFGVIVLVCRRPILNGIWRFWELHNTRYTITHGRIYVKVGVFQKKEVPYELFRVRHIEIEQSFINYWTKDGTLVIHLEYERGEPRVIKITGLARGEKLMILHRKLLNLAGLLRSVPEVKGFIQ